MSIIFKTEYYEPKLDKWISFWSDTLDECMNKLGYPIIGDVPQRVTKYEKSGVRKIKYKLLEVIKQLSSDEIKEKRKDILDKIQVQ
jgi:hypothetical protein